MTSFLEGSLARTIGKALKSTFIDAVLERDGPTTGPDYDPVPGAPVTFACKVVPDEFSDYFRAQGLVNANESKVIILASTLATEPTPGDRITFRDKTFTLIDAKPDPAIATWTCKVSA